MMKRVPLKRKPGPIGKKTAIKRKAPSIEKIQASVEQREKDREFYNKIWASRLHRCVVCNAYLGSEMKTAYMDHLLEKSVYPELRYEEENIAIVCLDCHGSKTNGFPKEKHEKLIEIAYLKFINNNS
jgi:5-methylcytosine-specific restriction endonuclease McrA